MKNRKQLIAALRACSLLIAVTACTSKKSAEQIAAEVAATELASGEYFTVEIFTAETDTIPEYFLDSSGEWLIFRTSRQVKDISFISVGFGDNNNFYQDGILLSLNNLSTFIIRSYVSETIPNRGISFTDEKGNLRFFYAAQSGMDGSVSLMEFQNNPPEQSASIDYIGSFGPAGGIIFCDKGSDQGGWRYLETVPDGFEFTAIWGLSYHALDGLSTAIGAGKRNTEIIVQALKRASSNTDEFDYYERYYKDKAAADICASLNINGYNDWFLPSIDELRMMYENVFKEYGIHHYAAYWSSSDDGDESTWFYNFDDGTQDTAHIGRDQAEYAVFAVRSFSSAQMQR
jgi:hypothetical protein